MRTQDLRGTTNRRKRIAQLVGEHRQKLVLALIDVLECFLGSPPLSNVETHSHNQLRDAVIDSAGAAMYPAQTAGRMAVPIIDFSGSRRVALLDEIPHHM